MVILVDEDAPESDGFFCLAAEKVTAQAVNYMLRYGRGIVYVTLVDERIRELGIPMVPEEEQPTGGVALRRVFFGQFGRRARSFRTGTSAHDSGGDR